MAARTQLPPDDAARLTIRPEALLERLQSHAQGKAEMSATQLRAAEILLKKSLPDFGTVQPGAGGKEGGGAAQLIVRFVG